MEIHVKSAAEVMNHILQWDSWTLEGGKPEAKGKGMILQVKLRIPNIYSKSTKASESPSALLQRPLHSIVILLLDGEIEEVRLNPTPNKIELTTSMTSQA